MTTLLPSQEAALAQVIARSPLRSEDFDLTTVDGGFAGYMSPRGTPGIVHAPTGFYFGIARHLVSRGFDASDVRDLGFRIALSPGHESETGEAGPLRWTDVLKGCEEWLENLRRELQAPLFAEVLASAVQRDEDEAEEPFTEEEVSRMSQVLTDIQSQLAEMRTTQDDARRAIETEFAELRRELTSMKRGKWGKYAIGVVMSLTLRQVWGSETARAVWVAIETALGGGPTLPPGEQ